MDVHRCVCMHVRTVFKLVLRLRVCILELRNQAFHGSCLRCDFSFKLDWLKLN